MFNLLGKVALITGGASGIGFSLAQELLRNGLKGVAICDVNKDNGFKAIEKLKNLFGEGKAIFIELNVVDRKQFDDAFQTTIEVFKNLDIVVNSAGIIKEDKWEEEIAVNLGGTVSGTYLAVEKYLPKYRSEDEAVVVNVSSIVGFQLSYGNPVYTATKHGIIGLSRAFGGNVHYERTKVKVLTICPGFTNTPLSNPSYRSYLGPHYENVLREFVGSAYYQTVEALSNGIIKMIVEGKTGSVWVSEDDKDAYEIEFSVKPCKT
ncbi:hypothetical protein FQA39_LY03945 [Lamprigera yunnana]|nr:hypothetical protein FQA39_LY03945 [Lamprigera yunnana]